MHIILIFVSDGLYKTSYKSQTRKPHVVRGLGLRGNWVGWCMLIVPGLITSNFTDISPVELWRLFLSIY